MLPANTLYATFFLFVVSYGAILEWSVLPSSRSFSSTNLKEFAEHKIKSLKNLRNKLQESSGNGVGNSIRMGDHRPKVDFVLNAKPKEVEISGGLMRNLESFLLFTAPLKKLITSRQGIEQLATIVLPKRDTLKKLLEIKGNLEPTLRRYLTDKFNNFLTSLIPYSENIGVPPIVLNSMKIPQDFDPRWQLIQSILSSNGGLEKFIHSVVSGETLKKLPELVESRSGDETDLISDQEPDATGPAYRRQQQLYLSSFKKRLMVPADTDRRVSQYDHVTYEVSMPEEADRETYYTGGNAADMDMAMSASGGRGHQSHGHGHASYGGFLDPFTILGGLAFLTYLGLMLQNSLNRNNTMIGRSLAWDTRIPVVPIHLQPVIPPGVNFSRHRTERALATYEYQKMVLNVDHVIQDLTTMWKQLNVLQKKIAGTGSSKCERYELCRLALKLKDLNLQSLLDLNQFFINGDERMTETLQREEGLARLCQY